MSSDLLDPSMELYAVPVEESERREQEAVDAAACVTRLARDEKDRALLLAALGLVGQDYADSLDAGLTESLAEYDHRIGGPR